MATAAARFAALDPDRRITVLRKLVAAGRLDEIPAVVPPRPAGAEVRPSPAQEDLWVYESLYPGTAALNLCCAYHFREPVDPVVLERVLTILRERHDVLRMRLAGSGREARLVFPDTGPFTLGRQDLRGATVTLAEALAEFGRLPFDLAGDGPIRGRVLTREDGGSTLVLALHHIATDWWSFDVLHGELAETYRAVRDGAAPPGERSAVQYADFANWQRELETAGVFAAQLDFWRDYLADPPAPLRVPGPGPGGQPGIRQVAFRVDEATASAVRAFARTHGVTVYAVLMTAFAVFAGRLTGQPDLLLGTPIANRGAKGLERLIGYVMNVLPTRWRIGPDDRFTELVRRFGADFARLMAHGDVPVGRIVTAVRPERTADVSPLFQWVFMYLPLHRSAGALRSMARPERVHTGGEHDLVGIVQDTETGMAGTLEIRTDRYDPATVRHWTESFTTLLAALLAEPHRPVAELPLVGRPEPDRPLDREPAGAPVSLAGLVARQAGRTPDAVAVESADLALSYGELARRVARLAHLLRAHGVRRNSVVAVALPRSVASVVAVLAVQWAGADHLPLDPDHPADRIGQVLADARPDLLLTDRHTLPGTEIPRLVVPDLSDGATVPCAPSAGYVMYTSGSTGRPKGVVVGSTGIAALAATLTGRLGLDRTSRVLNAGSPAFDITVAELCMAFGPGGALVVPEPGPLVGAALGTVLTERKVTAVLLPPAILASVPEGRYPDLRTVCVGADTCPPSLVAAWAREGRTFHNAYGPTEFTVAGTLSGPLPVERTAPPIGSAVVHAHAHVLDERLRPVPIGVPGELYLAGDGVAVGYLGRPSATAERFVPDPFGPAGTRMYRTGDVVRWRPDGQLDFLGRVDRQLKLRGVRVEPAEIETVLSAHDGVAAAAVTVHDNGLVAYLVAAGDDRPSDDDLVAFTLEALPAPMVPSRFGWLDAIPLTPNGKLDRDALPAPHRRPAVRAARTARENLLCSLFAELTGVAEVGVDDGFFDLGGDSIGAIQLAVRARAAGLRLTPRDVLTARTPARLAAMAGADPAPSPVDDAGTFPLTPMMHWWLDVGGDRAAFTMSLLCPTPAGVDRARIAAALRTLVDRHGALRMRLLPERRRLEIRPADGRGAPLTVVDASTLDAGAVRSVAERTAGAARLAPEEGRMLTAVWYDAGPERAGRLLLTAHHIAVDVVSWQLLETELTELLLTGELTTPAPAPAFGSWTELLHRKATDVAGDVETWRAALSGVDARLLDAAETGTGRETLTTMVPAAIARPVLDRLTAAFRCGPEEALLAALLAACVRWRGHGTGLLVDVESHGRDALAEVDPFATVGWFTSQHPVRLDAGTATTEFWTGAVGGVLNAVKEQTRAVPAASWGLLRYLDQDTAPAMAGLPVADLRFNYLGRRTGTSGSDLIGMSPDTIGGPAVQLDVLADGSRLVATWSYDPAACPAERMRALADEWVAALGVLAGAEQTAPAPVDFPLADLSQDELDTLTADLAGEVGW